MFISSAIVTVPGYSSHVIQLPRRFEKPEWVQQYHEYLRKVAENAYNAYFKNKGYEDLYHVVQTECTDYIYSHIRSSLSQEEVDLIHCFWLEIYFKRNKINDNISIILTCKNQQS